MFLILEIVNVFYFFIIKNFHSLILNDKYNKKRVIDNFKSIIKYFLIFIFLIIISISILSIFQIGNIEEISNMSLIVFFFSLVVCFFLKIQGYFLLIREDLINYRKDLFVSCFFIILLCISNYQIIYKEIFYDHIFIIQIFLFLFFMSFKHIK